MIVLTKKGRKSFMEEKLKKLETKELFELYLKVDEFTKYLDKEIKSINE